MIQRLCHNFVTASPPTEANREEEYRRSSSSTSSDSDSDFASFEELVAQRKKPLRRQRKRYGWAPPRILAKPRDSSADWMYHKYPILKYFVTTPADAVRYPHKKRC